MIRNIINKVNGFRQSHQFIFGFSIAFFWNLIGILLPTIACGILLGISGLQSFFEYFMSDLSKAAFSFSSASLLCVELIHGNFEGSLQVMAALECRWQLARLTLYDKPEVAKMQLSIAEERLATLNKQPSLGYPYLEMSLCYALLGMRAECRGA